MRAILAALAGLSACTTTREREARDFVHWDAMSDARNSARDACGGDVALIEGAEGYSAEDYRCIHPPQNSTPKRAGL